MTVHQIAKLAKVSTATVSRVLNDSSAVKPETAEVVRRIIEQHGNPAGPLLVRRGPRQGSRRSPKPLAGTTIAIASLGQAQGPWFEMPVMAKVISGITREARERGLIVQIQEGTSPDELGASLRARGVNGVLTLLPSGADPSGLRALSRHLPVVHVMGEATAAEGVDHVGPDNIAIGAISLDYLMAEGCRHVAFLTANPQWDLIHMRAFGFQTRALQNGMAASPTAFIVATSDADRERYGLRVVAQPTLEAAVEAFVKSDPRPAGLFVPRDEETVTVYRLLAAHGVAPGRHVTVVSCDNEELRLSALHPRPASIELGTMEIGRQAVRRLLSRIRRPHEPAIKIQAAPRLATAANSGGDSVRDVLSASDL